jgi:hypothetical protein
MSDFKLVKLVGNPFTLNINVAPKGVYNSLTTYIMGDSVSYGTSSYVATQATLGNIPTNTTYWQLLAGGGSGGSGIGESGYIHQITAGEISAKQLTLASAPATPSLVKVDIAGGCVQVNGIDFTVTSDNLSWNALGMETVISVNDYIQITY